MKHKVKYYNITEFIDIETGEIIDKKKAKELYRTIKTEKQKTEYNEYKNETYGVTRYTRLCKRKEQLEFKFD